MFAKRENSKHEEETVAEDAQTATNAIALPLPQPQGFLNEQVHNAPAWLISIVGHGMFILLATAITFTVKIIKEEPPIFTSIPPTIQEKIPEPERIRDIFDSPKGLEPRDTNALDTEEQKIHFPGAIESDRNRSANDEDYDQMKGDNWLSRSYIPGNVSDGIKGRGVGSNTPGAYDIIGLSGGGGGSGRYGGPFGSRIDTVARGHKGATKGTESAVDASLHWLIRHQNPDGSWGASSFQKQCVGTTCSGTGPDEFNVGVSSLALLAFLGRGYTHLTSEYYIDLNTKKEYKIGEVVKKAITWLISQQDSEGCIGKTGNKYMYNHSAAALALAEAYGMTNEGKFKDPAQRAVNYLLSAQNQDSSGYDRKAWRYSYRPGDNDTSVMGWCVMALKSAEISGLANAKAGYGGAITWVKEVTDENNNYRVGYTAKGTGKVSVRGVNDTWSDHDALTAIGMLVRMYVEKNPNDPALKGGSERLTDTAKGQTTTNLPKWDNTTDPNNKQIDFYNWYYSALAMYQFDGPNGPMWTKWNEHMKTALCKNQHTRQDGCADGSWSPELDRWGFEGGRVYATAINALTLEVYYRYMLVLKK